MTVYLAKRKERLDAIIFSHYGTIRQDVVNEVLEANEHLLNKIELNAFDKVYLPVMNNKAIEPVKSNALW